MNYGYQLRIRWLVAVLCGAAICVACNEQAEKPQAKARKHHRFSEPKDEKEEAVKEDASKEEAVDNTTRQRDTQESGVAKRDAEKPSDEQVVASADLEPKKGEEKAPEPQDRQGSIEPGAGGATPPVFADQLDPAELIVPKVLLTHGLAETCLIKVGDLMPDLKLVDLDGKTRPLSELYGSKLTVVLFWRAGHPYDLEELADLAADVAAPYSERGVNVVAINEDKSREEVLAAVERLGITFPVLLDPKGKALAEVAVGKLPRTYLLDPSGKVLWFDLHYSRSTRRDLLRAVRFLLSEH